MIKTNNDTVINFRTRANIKLAANKVFQKHGLDMSSALNLFLHNVAERKVIPLNLITENGYTIAEELSILNSLNDTSSHHKYSTLEEMYADLNQDED